MSQLNTFVKICFKESLEETVNSTWLITKNITNKAQYRSFLQAINQKAEKFTSSVYLEDIEDAEGREQWESSMRRERFLKCPECGTWNATSFIGGDCQDDIYIEPEYLEVINEFCNAKKSPFAN